MNVLLNLKKLRVKLFSNGPETVFLAVSKEGVVTAKDIQGNANVEVVNKDLVIAHLEAGGKIDMEIEISKGRGYVPAEELRAQNQWAAGFLPVDALFSPVVKVHYDVENARVGQVTDYDRLILEIWTDGSLNPAEALIQSSKLLRESLNIFIPEEEQHAEAAAAAGFDWPAEGGATDIAIAGLDPKLRGNPQPADRDDRAVQLARRTASRSPASARSASSSASATRSFSPSRTSARSPSTRSRTASRTWASRSACRSARPLNDFYHKDTKAQRNLCLGVLVVR
jgi:hypothetical protein